jgi:hypothetical protein
LAKQHSSGTTSGESLVYRSEGCHGDGSDSCSRDKCTSCGVEVRIKLLGSDWGCSDSLSKSANKVVMLCILDWVVTRNWNSSRRPWQAERRGFMHARAADRGLVKSRFQRSSNATLEPPALFSVRLGIVRDVQPLSIFACLQEGSARPTCCH